MYESFTLGYLFFVYSDHCFHALAVLLMAL